MSASEVERAVVDAAVAYVTGADLRGLPVAVEALLQERKEQARATVGKPDPEACGYPSRTGQMVCVLDRGHVRDSDRPGRLRLHTGYAANGTRRNWWEYLR